MVGECREHGRPLLGQHLPHRFKPSIGLPPAFSTFLSPVRRQHPAANRNDNIPPVCPPHKSQICEPRRRGITQLKRAPRPGGCTYRIGRRTLYPGGSGRKKLHSQPEGNESGVPGENEAVSRARTDTRSRRVAGRPPRDTPGLCRRLVDSGALLF